MKVNEVYVPHWVSVWMKPAIDWTLTPPYPQTKIKALTLQAMAGVVELLVLLGVIYALSRVGGMGATPMKRSATVSQPDRQGAVK